MAAPKTRIFYENKQSQRYYDFFGKTVKMIAVKRPKFTRIYRYK
tara:strand:+ start:248 stop:379 length:132 start_codon:yes stop_codon:yes gene_type:complete